MSNIQPGDVVVCVAGNCGAALHKKQQPSGLYKAGRYYRVERITCGPIQGCIGGLKIEGIDNGNPSGVCAGKFRKIEPGKMEFERLTAREKEDV